MVDEQNTVAAPPVSEPAPPVAEPAPAEPESAADRLRAFEDAVFGKDAPRPHGQIERGIGSPFSGLDAAHRAHHAALEALIVAEAGAALAHTAADAADAALAAAEKRAVDTEAALAPPEPAAEPVPAEPPPAVLPPAEPAPAPAPVL